MARVAVFNLHKAVCLATGLALVGCGTVPTAQLKTPAKAAAQAHSTKLTAASCATMAGMMEAAFERADTNRDGVLSGQESGLNAAQFKMMDRDGDGVISHAEWDYQLPQNEVMQALTPFQPMVDQTFKALDANGDGVISTDEARAATPSGDSLSHGPEPLTLRAVMTAMDRADLNGDGIITRQEFPQFYTLISQDGSSVSRGWFGNIAQVLLSGYLAVTSRIAVHIAMHPKRKPIQWTPAKWNIPFEEISFQTSDGLTIRGWYIPAATPTDKTVIEVHGINDCRDTFVREGQIQMLNGQYNQLAFDLRNQGTSDGNITSFAYHEGKDVVAAVDYAVSRGANHVAAYGISLGAASVIRAAAIDPRIEGVVDDCSYSTVRSAFAGFANITFIPCPELIAAATLQRGNEELGGDMTTTEPIAMVQRIAPRPLLVIHGAQDMNIPPEDSQLNYQAAGTNLHKELWIVPGGGHALSAVAQPEEYRQRLTSFLQLTFANDGGAPRIKL